MGISVTKKDFELKCSVCAPNIHPVSRNFDLGLTFYCIAKNRVTFG